MKNFSLFIFKIIEFDFDIQNADQSQDSYEVAGKLIFEFQRFHKSCEFEGIGLGLLIVPRIIKRHKGSIKAESIVDKGATFYFSLPNTITCHFIAISWQAIPLPLESIKEPIGENTLNNSAKEKYSPRWMT